MNDSRRITLISRNPQKTKREWNHSVNAECRIVELESFSALRSAVATAQGDLDLDLARIIIDRSASASQFLIFLAQLPQSYTGDVLYIREDASAFLSAAGRGGDRVLYALSSRDLRFYLDTHDLVPDGTPRIAQVLRIPETVTYAM